MPSRFLQPFLVAAAVASLLCLPAAPRSAVAADSPKPSAVKPLPKQKPRPEEIDAVKGIMKNADLLVACERGDVAKVRTLLKEGVDPNATRTSGASALAYAVAGKHREVVSVLLDAKADPNRASAGLFPLFLAAENGDVEIVKRLLVAGADPNARLRAVDQDMKAREGDTALMAAGAPSGTASVVKALLGSGADVNAKAVNGKTAVMQAVAAENLGVLRALLDAKPDLSARMTEEDAEFDALTLAVGKGNAGIVGMLLDAGADARVKMDDEVTLLEFAILSQQLDVAAKLRKAGIPEPSAQRLAALRKAAAE
jgi:ankyrin repeat protein